MIQDELNVALSTNAILAVQVWSLVERSKLEDADNVVLLHGFFDNSASFERLVPLILTPDKQDRVCFGVDFEGHGKSSNRSTINNQVEDGVSSARIFNFSDHLLSLIELVDRLGLKKFTLIGHSMGGSLALLMSSALGERVKKLIMIDTFGPFAVEPHMAPILLKKSIDFKTPSPSRLFDTLEDAAEHRAKKNFVGSMDVADALVLAHRGTRQVNDKYQWSYDPLLKRPSVMMFAPQAVNAFFEDVKIPVLIVWTKDGLFSRMNSRIGKAMTEIPFLSVFLCTLLALFLKLFGKTLNEKLQMGLYQGVQFASRLNTIRKLPQYTVERLESGGHHVHIAKPEVCAAPINKFLK